jgi:PAS domain S-box-containing protein
LDVLSRRDKYKFAKGFCFLSFRYVFAMIPAEVSEAERVAVLHALQILDTAPDPGLDALVQLAAVTFGTSSAAISLIDEDRQWLKARVGALAAETRRNITFCNHTVQRDAVLVVNDAAADPIFQDNPLVCGGPAIRFYAGAPLTVAGARIGALCVIDQAPRAEFDLAAQATLIAMAKAIAATLELRHEVKLRRALARSLTEQTKKLALAESMAGVGHWDLDLRTGAVTWSHEMFRIHGVEQSTFIPTVESALSFLPAEDREAVQAALDAAARFGDSFKLRANLVRGWDKALRVVSVAGEVTLGAGGTPDAVFGVVQDVTEQENLLRQTQQDRERYRLLTTNATDMIATMAPDSTLLFVTPAVQRILGYAPAEMIGRKTLAFTHPDDVTMAQDLFTSLIHAGPGAPAAVYQFRARHKTGSWVWLEGQPRVEFDEAGAPARFQDVVRDITARKQMEADLLAARAEAEAAAAQKADVLANMSHELRTPLNSVLGFAEVLAERPTLEDADRRFVHLIGGAARRLLSIVNDVLDLSKIEAGAIGLAPAPVDLRPLVEDVVDMVRLQAAKKGLEVRLDVPPGPVAVLADADRIRQILLNLLGNAIKFTESGNVALAMRAQAGRGRLAVEMSVHDTGIGIPADRVAHLFQRFAQADGSIARRFGGTGLGLSISQALAAAMGGSIDVTSRHGEGSCFAVRLDLPAVGRDGALAGRRILLAEDVATNQELIGLFLAPSGAALDIVADGAEAVRAASATAYDVILMDMQMPVMNGLEAARHIRARGASRRSPIVALTGSVRADDVAGALAAGMDDHLAKPLDAARLLVSIMRWAGHTAASGREMATTDLQ